ncbi:ribosomal large subunit pseudouridine synthases, putative [Trichomonas vaginalis G3]|uniref:Ribosomal large subunit pseudouridine synthases, putative n=1 Tax=Trichomonas vaginalis (strain ATCC PRA-98 / G3) TaxID=412133 RepID=A2EYQ7_TRIV3|nr:pseudouridine synthase protein [Trichomonas vaginalis G3]EAY02204.1 ribosomal large subunit pseudouridine synthases, putative [Trichomonas vaginalis G3]KAI5501037.1 pseudouridine synthase protein [Trichomonas vaginalis G3]|eukprot:XP_001314542.1 ribosomal large subunit pseudouridine synthases [Trichomonas vaginalis G3]
MSVFTSEIKEEITPRTEVRDESNVIIIEPFRFIKPYDFTFSAGSKERWVGQPLIDVFTNEFRVASREEYEEKIRNGKIIVNGRKIPVDYRIGPLDSIKHICTRIEAPVFNKPLLKLGETDNYVAYLKPASVTVNTVGGYFYNSMVKRLPPHLHVVHRLDRVTSGIIVFAKNKAAATNFNQYLVGEKVSKTYIARVIGRFPKGEIICDQPLGTDFNLHRTVVTPTGKPSKTIFKLLKTNGKESIVEAHPITGRTHQIRCHLQYLGYPITNDEMYGGKREVYTKEMKDALKKAEKLGLWPCDYCQDKTNPRVEFQVYLHSCHYQTPEFDFHAPMPDWEDLDKFGLKESESSFCRI